MRTLLRVANHFYVIYKSFKDSILLTKTTAAQNEVVLGYHRVRGLYFLAVIFAATMVIIEIKLNYIHITFVCL